MAEFKHGKYIVTRPKEKLVKPDWGGNLSKDWTTSMMYLDNEVIKGAFVVECVWFWPTDKKDTGSPAPHTHDYDEVIAFVGTNFEDPFDLGGIIELYIDGERNLMNQSFLAFVPAGVVHCPLNILKIDRPIFHLSTGYGKMYS
ncbi:MAG: hypothetical protein A2Z29_10330 [Chloroflexi bacterium RBG_16_56_11]|nr:MAG: hypothetical protein A2Z29_10330 [Chloroflexi bacterium RBG_16_56_11]